MIKLKFFGKAEDGRFVHEEPAFFESCMEKFDPEKRLEMTVKVFRKPRSTGQPSESGNQNGYYWGVIVRLVADEIGELDQDLVHEWIQLAVGNVRTMPDGRKVPAGTSGMDTAEAEEYYSRARMWAAAPGNVCELGMYIPLPNEAEYE